MVEQEVLAKRFVVSPGVLSNTIRLLKLPANWQKRIISQEITPAHARELLPWTDVAGVTEAVDALVKEDQISSVADFRCDVIDAVRRASRTLDPNSYERPRCQSRPSKTDLARLDVRELKSSYSDRKERWAFNVPPAGLPGLAARTRSAPSPAAFFLMLGEQS